MDEPGLNVVRANELTAAAEELLQIAKLCAGTLPPELPGIEELYAHFGAPQANPQAHSSVEIRRFLDTRIAELLFVQSEARIDIPDLIDLLLIWHEAEGRDVAAALRGILVVLDAVRATGTISAISPTRAPEEWRRCLCLASDRERLSAIANNPLEDASRPRPRSVGRSMKALRQLGCEVRLLGTSAVIDERDEYAFAAKLHELLRRIGGLRYIDALFGALHRSRLFDANQERFRVVRRPGGLGSGYTKAPGLPLGYLLNLAAAHILDADGTLSPEQCGKLVGSLEDLCKHRCVLYDVEPYSTFDGLSNQGNALLAYLPELVLYDGMFVFSQEPPSQLRKTILSLLGQESAEIQKHLGFSIADAADVIHCIVTWSSEPRPFIIDFAALRLRLPGKSPKTVLDVVRSLVQPASRVNAGYTSPHQFSKVTFPRKPLIALREEADAEATRRRAFEIFDSRGRVHGSDRADWFRAERELSFGESDRFVVPNAIWAASGCLRALTERIAGEDRGVYARIGAAQESLIREMFQKKGVRVQSGKFDYRPKALKGDCDALLETETDIVLIESKKEELTMRAREGSTLDIALDLADSLLKAQLQLARQEWQLRFVGRIVLSGTPVAWNGRKIERIVVSLSDHGALHSRAITMNVLTSFAWGQVNATGELSKAQQDKLKRLQETCAKLGRIELELYQKRGGKGLPFYDAWFLPLAFVQLILRDSKNGDAFLGQLRRIKGVTTGMHDVFADYQAMCKVWESG